MSCEYCRGEKPLVAIEDDLFGVGAVIEGDELRVYSLYDGCCCAGDERSKIAVCPKCTAPLPALEWTANTLEELGVPSSYTPKH